MPVLAIHRSECGVFLGQNTAGARWEEWSFDPPAEEYGVGATGLRTCRRPAGTVAVRVPPGAGVEDVATSDGRTVRRLAGLDAAAVAWLAERRLKGFKLEVH